MQLKNKFMLTILKKNIKIKPEKFFLFTALTFGIFTVFITPPLQAPDENFHFLSVWRFSSLSTDQYVSASIMNFVNMHNYLRFNPNQKYSLEKFKQALSYKQSNGNLAEKNDVYYALRLKTIPWYLPAIVGMWTSKLLSNRFCINMWAGRLFSLIVYSIIIFYAIKISPYFKWGFVLLGIMPMSLFLAASLSYDSFTIAIAFLLIAATLNLLVSNQKITFKNSYLVLAGVIVISFLKFPYFIITAPMLFLKKTKFKGKFSYCFKIVIISILLIQFGIRVIPQIINKDSSRISKKSSVKVNSSTNFSKQKHKLFAEPLDFCRCLANTTWKKMSGYVTGFAGCLGWLDTLLPRTVIVFFYIALMLALLSEIHTLKLTIFDRSIFLLVGLGLFVFIHIIFYLVGDVNSPEIEGVQGRYFIPFAPLILLPFLSNICLRKFKKKRLYRNMFFMGTVLFVQSISIITLLQRYYFTYWSHQCW